MPLKEGKGRAAPAPPACLATMSYFLSVLLKRKEKACRKHITLPTNFIAASLSAPHYFVWQAVAGKEGRRRRKGGTYVGSLSVQWEEEGGGEGRKAQ